MVGSGDDVAVSAGIETVRRAGAWGAGADVQAARVRRTRRQAGMVFMASFLDDELVEL